MCNEKKVEWLRQHDVFVGERDKRVNTAFTGKFMVAEISQLSLPCADASEGGAYAVVGDSLSELVEQAYDSLCFDWIFTPDMVRKAKRIMTDKPTHEQAAVIDTDVIAAEMPRIDKLTGQANDARYMAYLLIHLITEKKV